MDRGGEAGPSRRNTRGSAALNKHAVKEKEKAAAASARKPAGSARPTGKSALRQPSMQPGDGGQQTDWLFSLVTPVDKESRGDTTSDAHEEDQDIELETSGHGCPGGALEQLAEKMFQDWWAVYETIVVDPKFGMLQLDRFYELTGAPKMTNTAFYRSVGAEVYQLDCMFVGNAFTCMALHGMRCSA